MPDIFARQLAAAFFRTSPVLRPAAGVVNMLGSGRAQLRAAFFRTSPALRPAPAGAHIRADAHTPAAGQAGDPYPGDQESAPSWFPFVLRALPVAPGLADLAAAGESRGTSILIAPLPAEGQIQLILHREGPGEYLLEVTFPGSWPGPHLLGVWYESAAGWRLLLVPVSGEAALVRLLGYVAGKPWAASVPFPVADMPSANWGRAVIAASVRAAAGGQTRASWRAIAAVVPRVRDVIAEIGEEEIGEEGNGPR